MRVRPTLLFVALLTVLPALPQAAAADATVYDMVFPIAGATEFNDTFGVPRPGGRRHAGTDIFADKMVPVVAVADGTVDWMHDRQRGRCCALGLVHDDGWESWYIHLNNDTPGTDDGRGWGFAPGIEPGVRVKAGQLIGWVGDSGNAEHTSPHLHFELHDPSGRVVNPYESLGASFTVLVLPLCPHFIGKI